MYSSGKRTARLLTIPACTAQGVSAQGVSVSGPWGRGVSASDPGGCLPLVPGGEGVSGSGVPGGCVSHYAMGQTSPPRGQTDTCENITFADFVCGR